MDSISNKNKIVLKGCYLGICAVITCETWHSGGFFLFIASVIKLLQLKQNKTFLSGENVDI